MQMNAHALSTGLHGLNVWSSIFTKTQKGRDEVVQRRAGLNTRQRSVLIMLDGIKRLDKLMSPIPKDELSHIVDFLTKQEFIRLHPQVDSSQQENPVNAQPEVLTPLEQPTPPVQIPSHAKPKTSVFLQDEKKLREIKDFMTTTAHTYMGLLSADLIRRIERAKEAPQLMAILGEWFVALRESKHGQRFASAYMEQILASLRGEETLPLPHPQ